MSETEVTEYREARWRSRMPDSIGNHSVRVYDYKGELFEVDRTCDASPRFYEIRHVYAGPGHPGPDQPNSGFWLKDGYHSILEYYQPECIKVQGEGYFGDGLSWPKAEVLAKAAMIDWVDGNDESPAIREEAHEVP
jgi:hypothetical protein